MHGDLGDQLLKPVYSNGFSATPSLVGVLEFWSFCIGRSSGLDITGGLERRCGFSLCAAPSLTSRRLNLRRVRIKNNKRKSLRGQGGKELKSIFELANTLSNYRLYTK